MKQTLIFSTLFIFFYFSVEGQNSSYKPSFSVVMDVSKGKKVLKQCSRSTPKGIKRFWRPTPSDIDILESNFKNIDKIVAEECCIIGVKIDSLQSFGFQYLGVIINNKKYIYINAFPSKNVTLYKDQNYDPTAVPVVTCDGGKNYWGVLFDPETKQFSSLAINGIG